MNKIFLRNIFENCFTVLGNAPFSKFVRCFRSFLNDSRTSASKSRRSQLGRSSSFLFLSFLYFIYLFSELSRRHSCKMACFPHFIFFTQVGISTRVDCGIPFSLKFQLQTFICFHKLWTAEELILNSFCE